MTDHFVYFVWVEQGTRVVYVGCTSHLASRLKSHAWILGWEGASISAEGPLDRDTAFAREAHLIANLRPERNAHQSSGVAPNRVATDRFAEDHRRRYLAPVASVVWPADRMVADQLRAELERAA